MQNANNISKEEILNLLAAVIDGIDGVESEFGTETLSRYWNVEKIEQARTLLDQLSNVNTAKAL
jgi:hypothetical protein